MNGLIPIIKGLEAASFISLPLSLPPLLLPWVDLARRPLSEAVGLGYWHTPVILATQEATIRRIEVWGLSGEVHGTPFQPMKAECERPGQRELFKVTSSAGSPCSRFW
jgi:hypothetical protein